METGLVEKVVIVTGASGGIGSAIARRFADEGANVVAHYRRQRAQAEALDLPEEQSLLVGADLTKETGVRRLFESAVKRFGRVDTLIANAGSWETRDVPLQDMPLKQWRATFDAVLTSTFLCMREFFRCAARQKQGNAVLIASTAGVFGEAGHADYASAKAAMAYGMTRTLKNEIARIAPHTKTYCGGRVNCICPGWTIVPRNVGKLKDPRIARQSHRHDGSATNSASGRHREPGSIFEFRPFSTASHRPDHSRRRRNGRPLALATRGSGSSECLKRAAAGQLRANIPCERNMPACTSQIPRDSANPAEMTVGPTALFN